MSDIKLKPCPCCDGTKSLFFYDYPTGAFTVCCANCGMRGPVTGYSKDGAITTWNALPRSSDIERVEQERDWLVDKIVCRHDACAIPGKLDGCPLCEAECVKCWIKAASDAVKEQK